MVAVGDASPQGEGGVVVRGTLWRKVLGGMVLAMLMGGGALAREVSLESLLLPRTAVLWVEGQRLGELIVGARARLEILLVDRPLLEAVYGENSQAPDWLRLHAQYATSDALKGKTLFIVRYKALIPWTFDPQEISVGDHKISWKDILTQKAFVPSGELPSGFAGDFAVAVPKLPKTASEVSVAYGEWQSTLKIPGR